MRPFMSLAIVAGLLGLVTGTAAAEPPAIIWEVNNLERIGGLPVTRVGEPRLERTDRVLAALDLKGDVVWARDIGYLADGSLPSGPLSTGAR